MANITIPTKSGYNLAAIYVPPQTDHPTYPLVILLHGHTGWKEEEHLFTLADELAAAGIASIRFDAPGSGETNGSWEKDYRVSHYLAVVPEVLDYMLENYPIDKQNVGIWGHSMGGMVAILSAAKNTTSFKAVCGSQPSPGNAQRGSYDDANYWREHDGATIQSEHFGDIWLPSDYFLDRMQYKTREAVTDVHVPLLLIAGANDDLVPAHYVKDIFNAAHEPKKYLEYETDHFYKRDSNTLQQINEATVEFFKKHL